MSLRQRKLIRATRILSKYFGIHSVRETAEMTALNNINSDPSLGGGNNRTETIDVAAASEIEATLINMIIDSADGAFTTQDFLRNLSTIFENLDNTQREVVKKNFGRILQVTYEDNSDETRNPLPDDVDTTPPPSAPREKSIRKLLGKGVPGSDNQFFINQIPSNPDKEYPGLSVYVSNSPRVTIESKNLAASTIFLNGVPNTELMRAVPYVNVQFFFPRPPISEIGQQLQNLSLNKFLLGAESPGEGSVTEFMANSDTIAGSEVSSRAGGPNTPIPDVYSVAGMELFTSPQTLNNINEASEALRGNPVLDNFRPLMTLQGLEIKIQPSRGLISYKNGTLSFVLHDRSRLAEVAEFIRADLYGTNEITIEYGWSHPDGNRHNAENPYGDLIDGLRTKEKYMVTNSSFTFDPSGQVNISLSIAMRGSVEFNTELMTSEAESLSNTIRDIEELQREIGELRQRIYPNTSVTSLTEIRGHQILNAAQDATSNAVLTAELRTALTRFKSHYVHNNNPSVRELIGKLTELFGNNPSLNTNTEINNNNGNPTAFSQIRSSIKESIQNKISILQDDTVDPFLPPGTNNENGIRHIDERPRGQEERAAARHFTNRAFTSGVTSRKPTSLARLLLLFVGQPLANTKKYDEVQMFFYPFNEYAGKASSQNIANFIVDTKYFADELARYRLEHISRSSVMSLNQFMNFIGDILLDDPAAPSYGLWEGSNYLFRTKATDEEGHVRGPTVPADADPAVFQENMHRILRGVTPDGTFRAPQIGIYIETLPNKTGVDEGDDSDIVGSKTILRLHIYDKASTAYEPIGRMLLAAQRNQVRSIGGIASTPAQNSENTPVTRARREIAAAAMQSAIDTGLIERLPTSNNDGSGNLSSTGVGSQDGSSDMYRMVGGPKKLKEFIMLNSPYIIFGAGGTTIKSAQMNSMQNSSLATVNLLRSFHREEGVTPNGENVGGLPMNVIPTVMNMECVGNPLLNYMQSYFLDFQTGTTVDNMYAITAISHKFAQGDFTTSVKFTPIDAWGSYRSLINTIGSSLTVLSEAQRAEESGSPSNTSS